MSMLVALQSNNQIIMAGDSRECFSPTGGQYDPAWRIRDDARKIHMLGDKVLFHSGHRSKCEEFINRVTSSLNYSIENFRNIAIEVANDSTMIALGNNKAFQLELCIGCIEEDVNGKQPVFYQISEYNNFEVERMSAPSKGKINTIAGGVYVNESTALLKNLFQMTDIRTLYRTIYNTLSDEKVGGVLTIIGLDKDKGVLINEKYPISENKKIADVEEYVSRHCHYLLGSKLHIGNQSGDLLIDNNGITAHKMNLSMITENSRNKINLNPANGLRIQSSNDGITWNDRLYADTAGNLVASKLVTDKLQIKNGSDILIDAESRKIDFSRFNTIIGQLKADNIDATNLHVKAANIDGTIIANSLVANASITSPSINGGNIVGSNIIGSNIIGTSTITGAIIQTSGNNNKIIMDSSGFKSHDNNGTKRISIESHPNFGYQEMGYFGQSGGKVGVISGTNGQLNVTASNGAALVLGGEKVVIGGEVNEIDFQNVTVKNLNVVAKFG